MVKTVHKTKEEIKKNLGKNETIEENTKCPNCGGILVTNYGDGISCTFCVDCDYNEYDYDL
jgi:ribosomal protein S27AE